MIFAIEYFPTTTFDIVDGTSIWLVILFGIFFCIGFLIIYKQVSLVKKGEFELIDYLQCVIYGLLFATALTIVMGMAFIFAVNTPDFWESTWYNPNPPEPPMVNPVWVIVPVLICLGYISFYPLIDFLFIALSEESDEGLTVFHKFLGEKIINRSDNKLIRVFSASALYGFVFLLPPLLIWGIPRAITGYNVVPFIWILVTWMLIYPLLILTYFGSKGYIAGISNVYYHLPDLKRSVFLAFEDGKRSMEEFAADPAPRIMLGLMLFVFVWAWISLIQTLAFFFSGKMAISTYSYAGMVFVTLLFGIIGYFTRFWGRKIKYRPIDIYFAAYLMAAVGLNVLVNFLIVNPEKLRNEFNYGIIGIHELIPNYLLFAFPAVIEEIILITITTFYFTAKNNEFTGNIKYAKITECGQIFDPLPLFNFIKSDNPRVRKHAEETLLLMYERIPLKSEYEIDSIKFRNPLIDGLSDPHPNSRRICYNILLQLEKDVPEIVLPWIIEGLESPNYDKSIPFARSLKTADMELVEEIPDSLILKMVEDLEWRFKLLGLHLLARRVSANPQYILNIFKIKNFLHNLVNDPDSRVQVEILNILAETSVALPVESIIKKLEHTSKDIRAAAAKNVKNLEPESIDSQLVSKIIPLMKDPSSVVRASIFEMFSKIGNFRKYFIPILPFLEGLTDMNKNVRKASILALSKYFDEEPDALDIDLIISKIDVTNNEITSSVLSFLGMLWDKDPKRILRTLIIFIKFDNSQLKQNISDILVDKSKTDPELIVRKLIKIQDVSTFVVKGIISSTIIKIANNNPDKVIPLLIECLDSESEDVRLNAVKSLDGLIDEQLGAIPLKPFLGLLQKDTNKEVKMEASSIISKIAKREPLKLKPYMMILLQLINQQESSVKINLSKSLLGITKISPELIPVRPIISFLSDSDSFIREAGAQILGYIGYKVPDETLDALTNIALNDDEWNVREAAVSSLGLLTEHVEYRDLIILKLVTLLSDKQTWVQRSALKILSNIKDLDPSQIPFETVSSCLTHKDSKVREASAGLLKIYHEQIDKIFDKILILFEDKSEDVRKGTINTMAEIINKIGIEGILSRLLKNLSDKGSLEVQRSIALLFRRTAKYEDEKIKKRIISLLKIRCEMSQDPIICETLNQLRES